MIINLAALAAELTAGTRSPKNINFDDRLTLKPLNLVQLRKRAKELRNGWRSGDIASLSRLAVRPDTVRVHKKPLQLTDAQQVLAIEHGHHNWAALKRFVVMQSITRTAHRSSDAAAPDKGKRTLHIAADGLSEGLALAGFTGDYLFLPFPLDLVPLRGLPDPKDSEKFLEAYHPRDRAVWGPFMQLNGVDAEAELDRDYHADKARLDVLKTARSYERVCIWSGPHSPAIKSLAFLLSYFDEPQNRPASLELVSLRDFPGIDLFVTTLQLPPETLRQVATWFRPVRPEQFLVGRQVWNALSAATPIELWHLLQNDALEPLAWQPEVSRVLEQLPALHDGLGSLERQLLQALAPGDEPNMAAVRKRLLQQAKPPTYLWPWEVIAHRLASGRQPAMTMRLDTHQSQWWFQITDVGRELLAGKRHWMDLANEPYWVGGVEVNPAKPHWCWDHQAQKPVLRQV